MNSGKPRIDHKPMMEDNVVYCRLCEPPRRVEIPAGVFYRLRDMDQVTCPNGHHGTLLEYKHAAVQVAAAHGPFIRYDHQPPEWPPREAGGG